MLLITLFSRKSAGLFDFNAVIEKMSKIKPLLPSLRERKRYIVFEILSEDKSSSLDFDAVSRSIKSAFQKMYGVQGLAESGLWILKDKWDKTMNRGIVKVNHRYLNAMRATLAMLTAIDDNQVLARSVGASGTLKKAQKRYMAS